MADFVPTHRITHEASMKMLAAGVAKANEIGCKISLAVVDASGQLVAFFAVIFSMYGGGFATVPAYLRDMFGTRYVGAIHGLLLTAWSTAGVLGPVLVNYIRQWNVDHGVPAAQAYNTTMYVMAVLLVIGFICNYLVSAVDTRHHMTQEQADALGVAD